MVSKLSSQWNGKPRTFSGCTLETCYSVYADMDSSAAPHLCIGGLCIYATTSLALSQIVPITISVRINNGTTQTFTTDNVVRVGAYSPSGNWMPYYIYLTSSEHINIPGSGTTFTINVTATPSSGSALTFTESACGTIPNSITCPNSMYTGRAYAFTLGNPAPFGSSYKTTASLVWFPQAVGYYSTQIFESGYVDPYTKVEDASFQFQTIYFAVPNRDNLPSSGALAADSIIQVETRYLSSDFTDGIVISEIRADVPTTPRSEVDSNLAPVLTANTISITCAPSNAVINGKYVHKQAMLTVTPTAQYQYGDTMAYITLGDGTQRYASSITVQAEGVAPGQSYVRPDTGATATAGVESIRDVTMSVTGTKWGKASSAIKKTFTVLYYHAPTLTNFALHRASVSSTSTSYYYNGTYYKKDDFGTYCIIEYTTDISALGNQNYKAMTIQYGTHSVAVVPQYSGSGFIVVSAGTSSMEVAILLYDTFYPYGLASTQTLSVNNVLIEFLAGGKGMAVGKNATVQNALDINSAWKLLFYKATVGAYNGSSEQDLVAWMKNVDQRLAALESTTLAN